MAADLLWTEPTLPGWTPPSPRERRLTALVPADAAGRWVLDFHTPHGLVPLAYALVDDLAAGAVAAAAELGLPGGLQARLVGCHLYLGVAAAQDDGAAQDDAAAGTAGGAGGPGVATGTPGTPDAPRTSSTGAVPALSAELTAYALDFRRHWADLAAELVEALDVLDRVDLATLDDAGLLAQWRAARALHERAWRIHFAVMYRLMTVHEHYLAVCRRHGVPAVEATRMIEGEANTIGDADRAIRALAELARSSGTARLLVRTPTTQVLDVLRHDPQAATLVAELEGVQRRYGRRTSALFDLESAAWSADATPLLALVRSALVAGPPKRSWGPGDARTLAEQVWGGLDAAAADQVREAWSLAVAGNASWWSEEHNSVIDLRAHLPAADVAREAARRMGRPVEQVHALLAEEFEALLAGETTWGDVEALVTERVAFTAACRRRRRDLPPGFGDAEAAPDDVVFRQVMGIAGAVDHLGDAILAGHGVSPGVARGTVRLVRHAEDIVLLRHGDVLVCEATSPSWTPAFDRIAGAVCDGGGLLTHAAIISREYGVPCVCATLVGTTTLRDGDLVEVDGTAGTVRLLRREALGAGGRGGVDSA